jgi:hypothetical protein
MLLPPEVFRTTEKGWGLRCARDIPVGAFVCSYEGMLLAHKDVVSTQPAICCCFPCEFVTCSP